MAVGNMRQRISSCIIQAMRTNCGTCGVEINVQPYRLRRTALGVVYCSPKCNMANPRANELRVSKQRTAVACSCPVCGRQFTRKPAELRAVNYCSRSCSAKANMTLSPIPKGERRGRSTEFKKGVRSSTWQPVGTVRHRTHRGVVRAWVKVAEPNVWRLRAVVTWEAAHGPLPSSGYVVHHRNRNALDDRLENLQELTRAQHLSEHRQEIRARRHTGSTP